MQTVELKVDGMTCGSCVKAASHALGLVPGVEAVDVRLDSGTASVRGADVAAHVPALLAALAGAGYQARVAAGNSEAASEHRARRGGCGTTRPAGGGCCCGH